MLGNRPDELTIEEVEAPTLDPHDYQVVAYERVVCYVLVIIKQKPNPTDATH